jgi:DNA-directed RNA polymerase specialized sigma24 family protein
VSRLPPFQRLLDAHSDDVLRFLIASVGRHDADDAFQETFLSALRAYPRLRPGSNLKGWILTIAHHKAIDVHRGRGRRPVPVADPGEHAGRTGRVGAVGAPGPDSDHWDLVRALPQRQREVLTLRYAADLTHAEIATALGCSEEAARRAASDGLENLRKDVTNVPATA